MADEWLRAADVAAIADDARQATVDARWGNWPGTAVHLCAQDARWRALVGELLAALAEASRDGQANGVLLRWQGETGSGSLFPASARALAVLRLAKAALDGGA